MRAFSLTVSEFNRFSDYFYYYLKMLVVHGWERVIHICIYIYESDPPKIKSITVYFSNIFIK